MGSALSSGVWKALRQKSVGFVLTSLGLGLLTGSAVWANSDVEKNIANEKNWAMQAGDMSNQRYSRLKQINKGNVDKLRVAWTFSTGVLRGHEGSPLVVDGIMYLHSPFPNKVFAVELDTQKILWKYEPKQDSSVIAQMCCDTVNRGVAYAENKVILQQADSILVALSALTPIRIFVWLLKPRMVSCSWPQVSPRPQGGARPPPPLMRKLHWRIWAS